MMTPNFKLLLLLSFVSLLFLLAISNVLFFSNKYEDFYAYDSLGVKVI